MDAQEQQKPEPPTLAVGPDKASQITDTSRTRIFQAIRDGELTARARLPRSLAVMYLDWYGKWDLPPFNGFASALGNERHDIWHVLAPHTRSGVVTLGAIDGAVFSQ